MNATIPSNGYKPLLTAYSLFFQSLKNAAHKLYGDTAGDRNHECRKVSGIIRQWTVYSNVNIMYIF